MGIDTVRYHGWSGRLRPPAMACGSIVRVALLQVFRRKSYWLVLALGLSHFVLLWSVIYGVTQFTWLTPQARARILEGFGFEAEPSATAPREAADPDDLPDNGYLKFIYRQSTVVMILLAFSGSLLVGSDFRRNALPFYLSRRIDRRHYIAGKLLAVSVLVSLLTTIPALVLFFEYGIFTSSVEYWIDNWQTPVAIIAYGTVLCFVLSTLIVTLSAYLGRSVPIAITWTSMFLMLNRLARYLWLDSDNAYWSLLDLWRDMRMVGEMLFATNQTELDASLSRWSLGILAALCAVCLVALTYRVRAVETVKS